MSLPTRSTIALFLLVACGDDAHTPDAGPDADLPPDGAVDAGPPVNADDCWGAEVAAMDGLAPWSEVVGAADPDTVVTVDRPVRLDGSIDVGGLRVVGEGRLVVGDVDATIRTPFILIEAGGVMQAGSDRCPYARHLEIVVRGEPGDPEVMGDAALGFGQGQASLGFGNKVLAVGNGGTLALHGAKGNPGWARLAETVESGASTLVVDALADWEPGDEIVVSTTDFEPHHNERRTIAPGGVQPMGDARVALTVTAPFEWAHFGGAITGGGDVRGSVGLLSRDIVVRSELGEAATYGAQAQFRFGSVVRLDGVEFSRMGQPAEYGNLGRYPVHFHLAVDASASHVRRCAVHESFTRWYVVHGTHGVTLEGNVGYRSFGHGYYIEDGTESLNVLRGNLGVEARPVVDEPEMPFWNPDGHRPLTYSDTCNPSVFWIANQHNTIVDNVAAGCGLAGRGFWLLASDPDGRAAVTDGGHSAGIEALRAMPFSNGKYAPVLEFRGNTASGCFYGFDSAAPNGRQSECAAVVAAGMVSFQTPLTETEAQVDRIYDNYQPRADGQVSGEHVLSVLDSMTSFRNRWLGGWFRDKWYWIRNGHFVDNLKAGLSIVTAGDESGIVQGYWGVITDVTFVGFSENGFEDRGNAFRNTTLVDPVSKTRVEAGNGPRGERRGLQLYDGPTGAYFDRFFRFGRYDELHPDAATPDFADVYLDHTAIGWFGPGNQFQYSALTETSDLEFDDTVGVRHFVQPPDGDPLLDGDKQTFILDLDGTLQGYAGSGSINDFPVHRGPVWEQECHSAASCIASPYRYGNTGFLATPDDAGPFAMAKRFEDTAGEDRFVIAGFDTAGTWQWQVLTQLGALSTAQFLSADETTLVAPPPDMHVRLSNVNAGESVRWSLCYPEATTPSEIEVFGYGTEIDTSPGHSLPEVWAARLSGTPMTLGEPLALPGIGTVTAELTAGNLVLTLEQTEARSGACYPAGTCVADPAAPGECTLAAGVDAYTAMCDACPEDRCVRDGGACVSRDPSDAAYCARQSCESACRAYGNRFNVCPEAGCATVRVRYTGARDRPLSPACSEASSWPSLETIFGAGVCETPFSDSGTGGATCAGACGGRGLSSECAAPPFCG